MQRQQHAHERHGSNHALASIGHSLKDPVSQSLVSVDSPHVTRVSREGTPSKQATPPRKRLQQIMQSSTFQNHAAYDVMSPNSHAVHDVMSPQSAPPMIPPSPE